MAIVQAFNRERAFQREFEELNDSNRDRERSRAEALVGLLPGDRAARRRRDRRRALVGARSDRRRLAHARHADRRRSGCCSSLFQPLQELSELYGQVQSARAAMGKISQRPRHRDRHRRPARRASRSPRIEGRLDSSGSRSRTAPSRCCTTIDAARAGRRLHRARGRVGRRQVDASRKLIARFYDPDAGAVRVDGVDLRDVQLAQLPPPARRRAAGPVPLLRHDRRQHPLRAGPTRPTRRCASVAARGRRRPGRGAARRRARAPRPRGRRRAVRGRAPADLDRPRAARRPADPDPRRGDLEHRPADRGPDRARARPAAARPHVDHHRPPAGHRPPRRRDPRRRARPDRSARHRGRAAGEDGPFRRLARSLQGPAIPRVA